MPQVNNNDGSDVVLAGDPSSVLGGNGATPISASRRRCCARRRSRGATEIIDRSMAWPSRGTYIPLGREDRGLRREDADETTPGFLPAPGPWSSRCWPSGLPFWYWLQPPRAESLYEEVAAAAPTGRSSG